MAFAPSGLKVVANTLKVVARGKREDDGGFPFGIVQTS